MAKHILDGIDGFIRRSGEQFDVDPRVIKIEPGWNARTDFSGEDELMNSIVSIGVQEPLKVKKDENGVLWLRRGERRLRATMRAISNGHEIKAVPVVVVNKKTSDADLFFDDVCSNGGKPLTPTEEADAFKRLKCWGYGVEEIATRTGRSISHVRNRLEIADAIPSVKEAIRSGDITISQAQEIVKESGGDISSQGLNLTRAKSKPKTKRAVFALKGDIVKQTGEQSPCEPIQSLLKDDDFIQRITDSGYDPDSIRIMIKPWVCKKAE